MTAPKQLLIIMLAVASAAAFADSADLNRLSLIMRADDVLKVDVRKLISFKSSSINFFSNNPQATLPGVSKKKPATFLPDQKLTPVLLKSKKGRIFVVQSDRASMQVFDLVGKSELRPIATDYKFEKLPNFQLVIADIHLEDDWLTVLFFDAKGHENPGKEARPTTYHLFSVNIWENKDQSIVSFKAPWAERPTLKLFTPHPEGASREMTFLIFDKESTVDGEFSNQRTVTLVKADFTKEGEVSPADVVTQHINVLLFGRGNDRVKLRNVLMTTKGRHTIFFVVQSSADANTRLNNVYSCSLNAAADPSKSEFKDCGLFKKGPVKQFFLKGQNYVAILEDNTMEFCNHVANSCREGKVQPDWDLRSVLMEENFAVIIMAIAKTKFVFINDFKENSLVWFYDDATEIVPSFLLFGQYKEKDHLFLAEVPEKGLRFRDVSFYPYFKIKGSQLKLDQLTNVYLEDKLVLSYDLKPLGDQKVKNLQEDRVVDVLTEPKTREFRTKIDVVGSNLRFPENGLARIKYFNQMSVQILWEAGELKGQYHVFYKDWMFFEKAAVRLTCAADKEKFMYFCKEAGKLPLTRPIHVKQIREVEEAGSLIILTARKAEDFYFFDRDTGSPLAWDMPERFRGGHTCMHFQFYIACAYTQKGEIEETSIRVFQIDPRGLLEVDGFEKSFIASLSQFKKDGQVPSEKLTSIGISSFDFDNVQTDRLAVLFILAFEDGNTRPAYVNYLFNNNPNLPGGVKLQIVGRNNKFERDGDLGQGTKMILLDSQALFYRFRNRFDLFCYDGDSRYSFEYLDVINLVDVRLVNSHSLVIVIFQGHQEKHYFALFKITQNAAKQLLRVEEIEAYDDNHVFSTIVIDEWTLGFYQYNPVSGREYPSYMYFRNGPVLVSTSFDHQMMVSNTPVVLKFAQDKLFDVTRNTLIKKNSYQVTPEDGPKELLIREDFSFAGNMYDIELSTEAKKLNVKLNKPLMVQSNEEVMQLPADAKAADVLVLSSRDHILVQESRAKPAFRLISRGEQKPEVKVTFGEPIKSCFKVVVSAASVLCFWNDAAMTKVSMRPINSPADETTFALPDSMTDINILLDNASGLNILYRDVWGKYLCLLKFDKNAKSFTQKFIGKQEMSVDDINIVDFHFDMNDKKDRLTVIILDAHSNQLLFYHSSTLSDRQVPVLKKNVPLDGLDNAPYKLKCLPVDEAGNKYTCLLFSSAKIHYVLVENKHDDGKGISLYRWEVTGRRSFYNVLFATALDNTLNIRALLDPRHVYTYQKDIQGCPEPLLIRYNIHDVSSHYSSFALPLKDYKEIMLVDYKPPVSATNSKEVREIEVYHLVGRSLKRLVLRAGDYSLSLPSPIDLDGKRVVLHSYFFNNPNPNDFSFSFAQKTMAADEAKKTRNIKLVLLIVGIIVVSVLILIALFALLVLLRDRKKIQAGANQPADETEVDISYM